MDSDVNNGAEITAVASSAPAGDGGAESRTAGDGEGAASSEGLGGAHDELTPVITAAASATSRAKKGKPKKRTITRAQKDERNRKLKLARDAAKAARIAKEGAKVASGTPGLKPDIPAASSSSSSSSSSAPAADARVIASDVPLESQAVAIDDEDLQGILGLTAHVLVGMIPEKWGGGTLTDKERELLGRVLAGPVRPYVASSEAGPWVLVAGAFVQVLGIRAIAYAARAKDAQPTGHHRPAPDAPAPAAPAVAPATPSSSSKPAPRATVARGAASTAKAGAYDNDDV